jgi:hypothetical protein
VADGLNKPLRGAGNFAPSRCRSVSTSDTDGPALGDEVNTDAAAS